MVKITIATIHNFNWKNRKRRKSGWSMLDHVMDWRGGLKISYDTSVPELREPEYIDICYEAICAEMFSEARAIE